MFREKLLAFAGEHPHIRYFPSIPDDQFLFLLGYIDLMISNSSAIIEAADNVVSVPFDADRIEHTIALQLNRGRLPRLRNP
ncbi:hypothetical protein [Paenibacillus oleatilyticus]|uniref:hypothetical protein n=1 Tax=Paenibacillus oleatilyticus TaxID=2594886 RepID=UPI001C1FFE25|nr:hypothetical protein [Paenibacillus oleatilyticus]MBU7314121.1 hypothetical protein [Paenibacillus oleatilyticus]